MKFISVDCETTGIDPEQDQILSIGLVIEDTNNLLPIDELPSLHLVIARDRLEGNVFALDMNRDIIKLLKDYQVSDEHQIKTIEVANEIKFVKEYKVTEEIFDFLFINNMVSDKYTLLNFNGHHKSKDGNTIPIIGMTPHKSTLICAGKNFGTFDKLFIEKLPRWNEVFRIHQRIIDPAIRYVDWQKDELLPNLDTCMKRAGIEGSVTHDAVQDSKDVIRVLRTTY